MYHCMVKPITITPSSSLSKHSDQTGLLILTYLIKYLLLYKEKPEEGLYFCTLVEVQFILRFLERIKSFKLVFLAIRRVGIFLSPLNTNNGFYFSHIPMHTRSSDPYASSLFGKICPTSHPSEISVTNTI